VFFFVQDQIPELFRTKTLPEMEDITALLMRSLSSRLPVGVDEIHRDLETVGVSLLLCTLRDMDAMTLQ